MTPVTAPPEPAPAQAKKDPLTAFALTFVGTAAPVVLFWAGVENNSGTLALVGISTAMVLPSMGHWYAGKTVTTGMVTRLLGGAVAAGSLYLLVVSEGAGGATPFVVGLATVGVGAAIDLATVNIAVDDWNEKHAVKPTIIKAGDGYGLGVIGRF